RVEENRSPIESLAGEIDLSRVPLEEVERTGFEANVVSLANRDVEHVSCVIDPDDAVPRLRDRDRRPPRAAGDVKQPLALVAEVREQRQPRADAFGGVDRLFEVEVRRLLLWLERIEDEHIQIT